MVLGTGRNLAVMLCLQLGRPCFSFGFPFFCFHLVVYMTGQYRVNFLLSIFPVRDRLSCLGACKHMAGCQAIT